MTPFDPVKGAWILLMAVVCIVGMDSILIFVACDFMRSDSACAHSGKGLQEITIEVVAAISILVNVGRRDGK